jgi:hypothetical protein
MVPREMVNVLLGGEGVCRWGRVESGGVGVERRAKSVNLDSRKGAQRAQKGTLLGGGACYGLNQVGRAKCGPCMLLEIAPAIDEATDHIVNPRASLGP